MKFVSTNTQCLSGTVRVPGDKSISHRSIILGAISEGKTTVNGVLNGEDVLATANIFRQLGVTIQGPDLGRFEVHGVGLHGLRHSEKNLDCGNSGTSMRLLCGLLAGQPFASTLVGDASLSKRPMKRVIDPLLLMQADIRSSQSGRPPIEVLPKGKLTAIHYDLPMASAQVKSCVLLAGLYADGFTSVTEPACTRDHTERMLQGFGVQVAKQNGKIGVQGGQTLKATFIDVPSDISSAAFLMVAASIAEKADITLLHVGVNPTRTGVIDILRLMGANITVSNQHVIGGEPVADIRIQNAPLKGINIPVDLVPLAIDEFPVIFIAAANAVGQTRLTNAEELRVKESDRIAVMAEGLNACGINAIPTEDGMRIEGKGQLNGLRYKAAKIFAHGDHRIAMSFSIAAMRAQGDMIIEGAETVNTSFPGFVMLMQQLGLNIAIHKGEQ